MGALDAATSLAADNETDSVGHRLRSAREGLGLSLRNVASELNLMVSHVRGIEANRFAQLTNDKQFLGHVRGYAILVDLDADEIVDMYRSQSAAAAATIQAKPVGLANRYDSKWIAVGALAVACVGLGVWSLNQTMPTEATSSPANSTDQTAQKNAAIAPSPAAEDRIEIPAVRNATKSTASNPSNEDSTSDAAPAVASSKQAASNTPNTVTGKNALRAVGAKPLRKTLVELKNRDNARAQKDG